MIDVHATKYFHSNIQLFQIFEEIIHFVFEPFFWMEIHSQVPNSLGTKIIYFILYLQWLIIRFAIKSDKFTIYKGHLFIWDYICFILDNLLINFCAVCVASLKLSKLKRGNINQRMN